MTEHSPSAPTPSDFIGPVPLLATDKTAEKEESSEPFPLKTYLYNNNPFYVVSALLLLYAVQTFHGNPAIGAIDCWWMMAVLGGYALVLATIGVLIIRLGKVWEDARSILLILVLLFLAVSVSADDLFVHMETGQGGAALVIGGFLFCALVTEGVLRGAGIRLGLLYRVPFHLMLALFFVAPYWYSPGIHSRATESIDWHLLGFPVVASVLILTLIPAVRAGKSYADKSGTPWTWPLYPWLAFWVFVWAFSLRSFALCPGVWTAGQTVDRHVSQRQLDFVRHNLGGVLPDSHRLGVADRAAGDGIGYWKQTPVAQIVVRGRRFADPRRTVRARAGLPQVLNAVYRDVRFAIVVDHLVCVWILHLGLGAESARGVVRRGSGVGVAFGGRAGNARHAYFHRSATDAVLRFRRLDAGPRNPPAVIGEVADRSDRVERRLVAVAGRHHRRTLSRTDLQPFVGAVRLCCSG